MSNASTKTATIKLDVARREPASSRASRRLRRSGRVPGVLYGLGQDPVPFDADERELRNAVHTRGAVLELQLDGGSAEPAVVKETHRHPVRNDLVHVDLLRVDLSKTIQTTVAVHLIGADESPGVREGGVLEHLTRELNVEALPSDVPEAIDVDVSALAINDRVIVAEIAAPEGVTFLDDVEETVIATVSPPRLKDVDDEESVETETEVVGQAQPSAEGDAGDADSE